MAATVTVRSKAFGDSRIVFLARLLGCSWAEAFMRVVRLWSVCAEQQTDKPEVRHIRACLESLDGEKHLVESGLGDDKHRDPTLEAGVTRVRGCDETDWYYALIEQEGQIAAGKARAASAERDARGRFLTGDVGPPEPDSSQHPASDLDPDLLPDSDSPSVLKLPDPGAILRAEREGSPQTPRSGPNRSASDRRRELVAWAWNYAATTHQRLKDAGIDRHARNCWSGTNIAEPRGLLVAIVDDLTQGDTPNWQAAQDTIRNRIDVSAAEARASSPPTLRWFTPMRMWDAKSFARCAELSPEQAAQPRRGGHAGDGRVARRLVRSDDDAPPLPPTGVRP